MEVKTGAVYRDTKLTPDSECIKKQYGINNLRKEIILVAENRFIKRIMGGINLLAVVNLWLKWHQTWDGVHPKMYPLISFSGT